MFLVGLEAEGIYRLAGFHDDVEAIKMAFDKGKILHDNGSSSHPKCPLTICLYYQPYHSIHAS